MTARDIYLNLLDREPDASVIREYGCVDKLPLEKFVKLRLAVLGSDEYQVKDVVPDKGIVESVRDVYVKVTDSVDGGGVYNYARLIQGGFLTIHQVKEKLLEHNPVFCRPIDRTICWPHPNIRDTCSAKHIHLVGKYNPKAQTEWRVSIAADTWNSNYTSSFVPGYIDSHDCVPTFHELVDNCIDHYSLGPSQCVVYTNADIMLCDDFISIVEVAMRANPHWPMFSFRRDFGSIPSNLTHDYIMNNGAWFSGVDLFIIPVRWWIVHKQHLPKMYIGRPYWDLVLRHYIGNNDSERVDYKMGRMCEVPGLNAHIAHENEGFSASWQKDYNYRASLQYFSERRIPLDFVL